jgi:hypothetical protein
MVNLRRVLNRRKTKEAVAQTRGGLTDVYPKRGFGRRQLSLLPATFPDRGCKFQSVEASPPANGLFGLWIDPGGAEATS